MTRTWGKVNKSLNAARTWCLSLIPVLFFFISFFTYYCSYAIVQSYAGTSKSVKSHNSLCAGRLTQKKWESLDLNISRRTQLFLKLDDFFWREHLSTLPLPYGIKGSELQLLKVLAVTANCQMPANIENLECRTCVVIGNSFAIKNTSLGGTIDKYDVVIRLNDAPVRGYEDDVGNKTTMRFFYPESASYNPGLNNQPGTLQIFVPFKQQDVLWLKEILYNEKRGRKGFWKPPPQIWLGDFAQIRVLDPHFLHQTAEKLLRIPLSAKGKQIHPTTGMLAVVVALNYCDVVHIAGFGYPNSRNLNDPVHYFDHRTMKSMKNSYHDLSHEAEVLKRLEDSGAIFYLHPHS
ncbi:CMP-N-acetylneuraminate-beta-galactosamide-alpha-2,3-sialyltransferase 4 isoform X1 [Hippocampus comes]|uniref:CMP-N-acetylneuraminate-beta-galactosamide- alpha-2,3-sialyltransferase 4 isoform X1 n=1 Tax=Hippocampus comes TaxID=109280 RepID=UPI00094EB234|nr:PREDICTED: CMP-N-acetylneuraminate-beta-galactosamide-alpha-2,3-sialyltransferase 4-like isoform X1 [Hippocampus comes]XP_019720530.1 PREDICTED: CMP-N-acetylneuraminate-beta-galactosamide-alpha-2,3-sialyltransferase 4-like isoform X1 [Hippocampus comes]XP_019720531.1 PREDICTED: CMP-N-acetylneuraminate-beta-galactosamide-alpha-2,3-sialyltransferase 4-like isoform X1 [Hippocampus comes]